MAKVLGWQLSSEMTLSASCFFWQTTAVEPISDQKLSLISTRYQTMPSRWGCIFGRQRPVSRSSVWLLIGYGKFRCDVVTLWRLIMGLWSKCVQQYTKGQGLVESDEASFINEITRALKWKISLRFRLHGTGQIFQRMIQAFPVQPFYTVEPCKFCIKFQYDLPFKNLHCSQVPCKRNAVLCKFLSVHMSGCV